MTAADSQHGPLHGVRVLDLSTVIMGPMATQILGDLGADVICIEEPKGNTNRVMGPGPERQLSGVALNVLRNKRNVCLDLKTAEGRDAALRIAATCDVMVTNLRPGPLTRLGLAYEDVRAVKPDIVFCQAQGWPSDSARAADPAYDDIMQAATGIADAFTKQSGRPHMAPTLVADKVSGLTIAYAVLAALFHRERTGEGQRLEVPMSEAVSAFTLVEHGAAAVAVPPQGPAGYPRILTPMRRPQQTADGWISVLPYSRANYDALFRAGGRDDLADDPRLADEGSRIMNAGFFYEGIEAVMPQRTTAEWLVFCEKEGIPASAVRTLDELIEECPVTQHPTAGAYHQVPPPVRFDRTPASVRRHAPHIGEHTDEVLREVGIDDDAVAAMRDSKAIPR